MHIDRRLVGFGLFLITVGGVMVAVRQGVLSEESAREAWRLWPLVLVGIGLSIVLAGRAGAALGGLVLAVTFGSILGGVAATGVFPGVGLCSGADGAGTAFADASGDLGGQARVTVTQDCGDLAIGTVAGSTWSLSGTSRDGRSPAVDGGPDRLRIAAPDGGPFVLGATGSWDVVLPRDPVLDLVIRVSGGESRVVLGGSHLRALSVDANAGSIELDLRDAELDDAAIEVNFGSATVRLPDRSATATLSVNAGSAAICLPPGAGLRVRLESVAASNDFGDHGMTESGGTWVTPGFDAAEVRLDVRADVNAGSLTLDPARQCGG
jgi:hypothetical protein